LPSERPFGPSFTYSIASASCSSTWVLLALVRPADAGLVSMAAISYVVRMFGITADIIDTSRIER
jgi:hypothetical protein